MKLSDTRPSYSYPLPEGFFFLIFPLTCCVIPFLVYILYALCLFPRALPGGENVVCRQKAPLHFFLFSSPPLPYGVIHPEVLRDSLMCFLLSIFQRNRGPNSSERSFSEQAFSFFLCPRAFFSRRPLPTSLHWTISPFFQTLSSSPYGFHHYFSASLAIHKSAPVSFHPPPLCFHPLCGVGILTLFNCSSRITTEMEE